MVSTYFTTSPAAIQEPPIVQELAALFSRLDDFELLKTLTGPARRGPKGYDMSILWRCVVTKHYLGLPSTAALIRTLEQNPFIARACGIDSPDRIPHKATFSRFFLRLSGRWALTKLKGVSRALVREHYGELPAFGERVALDSTTLKGWVNGGKTMPSDPEAGWSVKKNSHGKTAYTLGWKLHLLVDCESELPIAAHVSAGNVNDFARASNVLSEARYSYSRFRPRYTMADAGYSGKKLFNLIRRQYHSEPVIQLNASRVEGTLRSKASRGAVFLAPQGAEVAEQHHPARETEGYGALLPVPNCDAGCLFIILSHQEGGHDDDRQMGH